MADARGGAAASFRLFIAATEWLCARSGRGGLPPALLAEHRSGMATPLAVATAALEAAFACRPGAASALSGVTPVALLPGHGAAALRLLAFLADISVGVGGKGSGGGVAGGPATAAVHWAEDEAPEEVEDEDEGDGADCGADCSLAAGAHGPRGIRGKLGLHGEVDEYIEDAVGFAGAGRAEEVLFREAAPSESAPALSAAVAAAPGANGKVDRGSDGDESKDDSDESKHDGGGSLLPPLQPTVDAVVWLAEVERVAPKLKLLAAAGATVGALGGGGGARVGGSGLSGAKVFEWRAHLDATLAAEGAIAGAVPQCRDALGRLADDLAELLEFVLGRENYVNSSSLRALSAENKAAADRRSELALQAAAVQERVQRLSTELTAVTEATEEARELADEKGATMTDTSPLIKVKAALSGLRAECKALDLQIGVLGHAVMQSRITHKQRERVAVEGGDEGE
jgi:hypothetical protein